MVSSLIEVRNLKKYYPVKSHFTNHVAGFFRAVDDVSFSIKAGETFGLVGESGCGKTTVGKSVLRLIEPTDGEILFEGRDIRKMNRKDIRHERKNMQIIFQDPYSSLNPRMTVHDIIMEPIKKHKLESYLACTKKVNELLSMVGLSSKESRKYPHEFSGGQRQRIAIARALAMRPKLIVCDEPVSALDVSVQAQILNLMKELQKELGVAYLFIAHGMPVVQHVSHRVGVMYLGKLVEVAPSDCIFSDCKHPYSQALMSAIPAPDPTIKRHRIILEGEVPSLMSPPAGCLFSSRCNKCDSRCIESRPELKEVSPGHMVACHNV